MTAFTEGEFVRDDLDKRLFMYSVVDKKSKVVAQKLVSY